MIIHSAVRAHHVSVKKKVPILKKNTKEPVCCKTTSLNNYHRVSSCSSATSTPYHDNYQRVLDII